MDKETIALGVMVSGWAVVLGVASIYQFVRSHRPRPPREDKNKKPNE